MQAASATRHKRGHAYKQETSPKTRWPTPLRPIHSQSGTPPPRRGGRHRIWHSGLATSTSQFPVPHHRSSSSSSI
ncbi:hypothetical protein PR202_ga21146 [Eleusine coracana subsp. coracana]|uniref:Uncharacterized protein n=1 Tax=Eleusine coracana subsp. coracana TaxID=191504 RepID=A0AAV5D095_ELECO|nr:hypothetical protein PR202_ga21146 [Eleusine coracana subsp. coracana]